MSLTGVTSPNSNIQWQQAEKSGAAKSTGATTGAGNLAGPGAAPGADPMANNNAIMASLAGVMPKMSGDQVDVLLGTIMAKMKDITDKGDRDKIKADQASKHNAIQEKTAKLEEAHKKAVEAADKMKHASVWDKIKLAFSYIAAILTMVAGAVMIATGAGAIAGGCLIAAGAVMLCLAIDQTVQTAMQDQGKGSLGMFGMMVKACYEGTHPGCSEDEANEAATKGQMGIQIGLMGVAMLLSLPAMVPAIGSMAMSAGRMATNVAETVMTLVRGGGQLGEMGAEAAGAGLQAEQAATMLEESASAAKSLTQTFKETFDVVKDGVKTAADTVKTMAKGADAKTIGKINDIASAGTQMADGVATIGSSVTHYQASSLSADAKHAQAGAQVLKALQASLDDQIDAAIQRLKNSGDRFNAVMDALVDAVKDRGDTMAHAKFRA